MSVAASRIAHEQVTVMQRSRLLAAAVGAVAELGWEEASIARITQRAGVSRRTFYEVFENREECLVAILENAVEQVTAEIDAAGRAGSSWQERVRGGLWAILCFFDREPAFAHVCLVESRRAGRMVLDYRQGIVDRLAAILDQVRAQSARASKAPRLTAQVVIGGVSEVLYSHHLKAEDGSLHELLGELMGMIVLSYLGSAAAHREQARSLPAAPSSRRREQKAATDRGGRDLLAELPMRLTYRTATVLQALAEHPERSNRQVADLVGIADQGQMSKLLSRLARLGLLVNAGVAGEPNRWALTPAGSRLTHSIKSYAALQTGQVTRGEAHAI